MRIGIPKEIKTDENRVAITPYGVKILTENNNEVFIEKSAGIISGFSDEEYQNAGACLIDTAEEIYSNSEMILKVKSPLPTEYHYLKKNQILFSFLHLAVDKALTDVLKEKKITAVGCETVECDDGRLPLLEPMSCIAGKMSVQIAAHLLETQNGGRGILLGGMPGVEAGKVLIIGAGSAGLNAAKTAVAFGANVSILDINTDKLRRADNILGSHVKTYISNEYNLRELIKDADVVIGAVLNPGRKTPVLLKEEMVKTMKKGSCIIDLSSDQGGIAETTDCFTTFKNPIYEKYGVIHYSVENIPSSVSKTAACALSNETIRYILNISQNGIVEAAKKDTSLLKGINTYHGYLTNKAVADSLNFDYTELSSLIGF